MPQGGEEAVAAVAGRRRSRRTGHPRQAVRRPKGADAGSVAGRGDTGPMGMDPYRPHRNSTADYVMVAAAVVVCVLLLVWAFLG